MDLAEHLDVSDAAEAPLAAVPAVVAAAATVADAANAVVAAAYAAAAVGVARAAAGSKPASAVARIPVRSARVPDPDQGSGVGIPGIPSKVGPQQRQRPMNQGCSSKSFLLPTAEGRERTVVRNSRDLSAIG